MRCDDRVALVTGGASGIGAEICRYLAAAGARVVIGDINMDLGNEVAAGIGERAQAAMLDVTDRSCVDTVVAQVAAGWGPIEILVNCAGGSFPKPFLETEEALIYKMIEFNLMSVIRCTQAVLPAMVKAKRGRLVNISSGAGLFGLARSAPYASAKGGVNAFTKTMATEMAEHRITCNAVCPGPVETPPMLYYRSLSKENDAEVQATADRMALGRLGLPRDIALAAQYFAADGADHVTGQLLSVNGGYDR